MGSSEPKNKLGSSWHKDIRLPEYYLGGKYHE